MAQPKIKPSTVLRLVKRRKKKTTQGSGRLSKAKRNQKPYRGQGRG